MQLSEDLSCQFSQLKDASLLLSTLNSFKGVLRSAAAAAQDLILAEVKGKQAPRASDNLWLTSPRPVGRTGRVTDVYYCGECVCVCARARACRRVCILFR